MPGISGRNIQYKDLHDPLIDLLYRTGDEDYSLTPKQCYVPLADEFKLTREERGQSIPSDGRNTWNNMVRWARNELVKEGLIDNSIRGRWKLSESGILKANNNIDILNKLRANVTKDNKEVQISHDLKEIIEQTGIGTTEKYNLIQCRIGQGKFRAGLIKLWNSCSVTSFNQASMLVASHIKPWSKSNNVERLDPFNGLLLLPNLDKVFDLGYITFDENGKIIISEQLKNYKALGLFEEMAIQIKKENQVYFEYHRSYVFKKS